MENVRIVRKRSMVNFNKTTLSKKLSIWDIFLIFILLVIALIFFLIFNKIEDQRVVKVFYHNKLIKKLDLNNDQIFKIDEGIKLEIKNGRVRMLESTCKRQYCVEQGWSDLYPVICVPNQILISIEKNSESGILITK